MSIGRLLGCALLLVALGCGAPRGSPADGGPAADAGAALCEARQGSDTGCLPVFAASCLPGTMQLAGRTDCVPVGVSDCGELERDDGGFGCAAKVPPACGPGERPAPAGCVALGDCGAPFPPSGTDLVVDDDGPQDATHVRTLAEALAGLPDGGQVAIEAGTYSEGLAVDRPFRLIGRCAALVRLSSPPRAGPALAVTGRVQVYLSGVTLSNFEKGVLADGASSVEVRDTVIAASRGLGFHARAGSHLSLADVSIHDTTPNAAGLYGWGGAVYGGGRVTATRLSILNSTSYGVLVSDAQSRFDASAGVIAGVRFQAGVAGPDAAAVVAQRDAGVSLDGFVLDDSDRHGVLASSQGRVSLRRSVVTRTFGDSGAGLASLSGSTVTAEDVTLGEHQRHGAFASGAGSSLSLSRSFVTRSGEDGAGAIFSVDGAKVSLSSTAVGKVSSAGLAVIRADATVTNSLIFDVEARPSNAWLGAIRYGAAVSAYGGARVELSGLTALRATTMGLEVGGGQVVGHDVLVRDVRPPRPFGSWGYGVGVWVDQGGQLDLERAALTDVAGLAVRVHGVGTRARFASLSVARMHLDVDGRYGHGVVVDGGGEVELIEPRIAESEGVGLAAKAGTVRLVGGTLLRNVIALDAQGGSIIAQSDDLTPLDSFELRVSSQTRFIENQSRVGLGAVPLPEDLLQLP